jgi:hypothetical protein
MEELERRLDIVTEELQSLKNESAVSGESDYSSAFGFGPAASKVYKLNKGLSIGGYGEGHFSNLVSDQGNGSDTADMLRAILYVGYKFSDRIVPRPARLAPAHHRRSRERAPRRRVAARAHGGGI